MKSLKSLFFLLSCAVLATSAESFLVPSAVTTASSWRQQQQEQQASSSRTTVQQLRGGSSTQLHSMIIPEVVTSFLTTNLQSGPLGVVALLSVASSVCIPITQIKSLYGIGVGYGGAVAAIGLALRTVFSPVSGGLGDLLTQATVFYGARLGGYLLLRDLTSWKKVGEGREEPPRWKRVPFALSLSVFYAFMTTPILYALRHCDAAAMMGDSWQANISFVGAFLAWGGALLQMIADSQKYIVKQQTGEEGSAIFQGPSDGVYAITRHPNYTGEVLFWLGIWLSGAPFFGRSIVAWLCGTGGLYGIITIMRKATKGLEERQEEKYGGNGDYESWKSRVTAPLFPFIKAI